MNKIFIVAGCVLVCTLLLATWFFFGNLGSFSRHLGEQSTHLIEEQQLRFIGTWTIEEDNSFFRFKSDCSFTHNTITGTYDVTTNEIVSLDYTDNMYYTSSDYYYQFSQDDTKLTLSTLDNPEISMVLTKIEYE